jgi:multisubunit Na+/H+ antiporter MnhF subunit
MMPFVYLLLITAIISSYRLLIGPTLQDRIVSLNCISVMLIVTLVLISIHYNQTVYLDIAIAFLLLDFVGIIAFTKYLGQEKIE